jgi:hypothetical protein
MVETAVKGLTRFTDWDATDLTWALDSLHLTGLPAQHGVVSALLARLRDLQEPDGRWKSADNPDDPIGQTLEALIVLHHYERLLGEAARSSRR